MAQSRWKSRKNKKRAHSKRRAFIRSYARPDRVPRPKPSNIGLALQKIANRMGDRGK
jgi:hypothetical protein